ncbi:uncharacterized protein LOC111346046 [Stylophora pistillata]|uniref:uncharacterized protein LOC111346046 n=1 Tax=Stylophora pistillata TaxID=50429 RepID=UPI000C042134|nr:uncharacterized protein LOC111346046 [Stylophora pistillata]
MATEGAREKPLSDKHRQILNRVKPDLLKDMDPDEVLLHMAADDVFTQSEEEKIQAQPTRWEKCKELLKILPRKGTKAYRIFRKVLQSAHPHLANSISERDNTRLGGEENSKQADRPRRAPDSRKFLDLLYCLPKEGEGMLTHLASQVCLIQQFPQLIQFFIKRKKKIATEFDLKVDQTTDLELSLPNSKGN